MKEKAVVTCYCLPPRGGNWRTWQLCDHPNMGFAPNQTWPTLSEEKKQKLVNSIAVAAVAMASAVAALFNVVGPPNIPRHKVNNSRICCQILNQREKFRLFPSTNVPFQVEQTCSTITCSATDKPTSSSEIRFSFSL